MLRVFAGKEGQAWSLLGYAIKRIYGLDRLPEAARRPEGKPYFPEAPHIHFSLSHSGSLVLCAVGSEEVGADIEQVRPRREGLPRFALAPEELEEYHRQGGGWEAFYALWTRKEAWCKFTGQGLPARPSLLTVPAPPPYMRQYAGRGWRGAVCGLEPPGALEWVEGYARPGFPERLHRPHCNAKTSMEQ